jgi:hypothetical protein
MRLQVTIPDVLSEELRKYCYEQKTNLTTVTIEALTSLLKQKAKKLQAKTKE